MPRLPAIRVLPPFDRARWRETVREEHPADGDTPGYAFVTLERS